MTSILKADTIQDTDGNNIINENSNTITIGASGDTTNIIGTLQNNGAAVGGTMTPAFQAYMSARQTVSTATNTKINFNTETFDSNANYDTSTYRFTPTVAGKYFIYASLASPTATDWDDNTLNIYKNGSILTSTSSFQTYNSAINTTFIDIANGSSDYYEIFYYHNKGSNTEVENAYYRSKFGAYKIIE